MSLTGANTEVRFTEHDLLQLKLDIFALQSQGRERRLNFSVGAEAIVCSISSQSAERVLKQGSQKALEYFTGWARSARMQVEEIVSRQCPSIRKSFDPTADIRVEIEYSYGMGSVHVCTFVGGEVIWNI